MPYINGKDGVLACGTVGKYVEYKLIGEKESPLFTFSIAVGKDENNQTRWFKCQAWYELADYCNWLDINAGDTVEVFGTWKRNEYNGQTYYNLLATTINKQTWPGSRNQAKPRTEEQRKPIPDEAIEEDVNDDDLPF